MTDSDRTLTPVVLQDGTLAEVMTLARPYPYTRGMTLRSFDAGTRIYVDEVGETVLDNLRDRFGRPTETYKAAVLEALQHINLTGYRVCWSQKAGCSCGCSPGFILRSSDNKHVVRHLIDGRPVDIWVKVDKGSLGESKSRDIEL